MGTGSSFKFFFQKPTPLRKKKRLKAFLAYLAKKEGKKIDQVAYIFCTDAFLLRLNKKFLAHKYLTDILTFNLSEDTNKIKAEIYISYDRIKANSTFYKTTSTDELHRVIFHGILHLCGYRDKTSTEKLKMRRKENFYLTLYRDFT
jgi:probable rRNA maturation factor